MGEPASGAIGVGVGSGVAVGVGSGGKVGTAKEGVAGTLFGSVEHAANEQQIANRENIKEGCVFIVFCYTLADRNMQYGFRGWVDHVMLDVGEDHFYTETE